MKFRYCDYVWPLERGLPPCGEPPYYFMRQYEDQMAEIISIKPGEKLFVEVDTLVRVARVGEGRWEPYKEVALLDREVWTLLNCCPDEIPSYLRNKLQRICYSTERASD